MIVLLLIAILLCMFQPVRSFIGLVFGALLLLAILIHHGIL